MAREFPVLVPPDYRHELLEKKEFVVIQNSDCSEWVSASQIEVNFLCRFLQHDYPGAPMQSLADGCGARCGWNRTGVFIHQEHHKRYFGLPRQYASNMLNTKVPEGVPVFDAPMIGSHGGLLAKLANRMPSITADMRDDVLHATFAAADLNNNGMLSRPELGTMMRRLLGAVSARTVELLMQECHGEGHELDGQIKYKEFVDWLSRSAPDKLKEHLQTHLNTAPDVVRASFRVWDKNGDGLMSKREMYTIMRRLHSDFTKEKCDTLFKGMDTHHDGKVDYDEYVDFLFHGVK